MGAPAATPPDPLVQMNVRVPQSVRDAIDERRGEMAARTGRKVSRDKWVTAAAKYALSVRSGEKSRPR